MTILFSVWAEPVEALSFFKAAAREGQPFDKLRANGFGLTGVSQQKPKS
jgi:hypothetical protein